MNQTNPIEKLRKLKQELFAAEPQVKDTKETSINPGYKYFDPKTAKEPTQSNPGNPIPSVYPEAAIQPAKEVAKTTPSGADPKDNSFLKNIKDGLNIGWESMKGQSVRGLAEAMDMFSTAPTMGQIPGSPAERKFEDYTQLKRDQAQGKAQSVMPDAVAYADKQQAKAKNMITERNADPESWGYMVGSLIPQGAGIGTAIAAGAVNPALGLTLGAASTGQLSSMAVGAAAEEYDTYVKETGQEYDPNARLGSMMLTAAAETVSEAIPVAKFVPKGFKGKMGKFIFGDTPVTAKKGKELLEEFANTNASRKQLVKNVADSMVEGAFTEGPTEAVAELGNEFSTWLYKEKEDRKSWQDIAKNALMATAGGAIMGAGLGPMSYGAQQVQNQKRRKESGKVILAQDKNTGEAVEIMGMANADKDGAPPKDSAIKYQAIRPNGKTYEVDENQLDGVMEIPEPIFNGLLKGKAKAESDTESQINQQVKDKAQQEADAIRQQYQPMTFQGIDGQPMISGAKYNGETVFVTAMTPDGAAVIQKPGEEKKVVRQDQITEQETKPFDQFMQEFAPVPEQQTPFDPTNPIQRGESVNINGTNWVVTSVNPEEGVVQLENEGDESQFETLPIQDFQQLRQPPKPVEPENPTATSLRDIFGQKTPVKEGEETFEVGTETKLEGSVPTPKTTGKTPATAADIDAVVSEFAKKAGIQGNIPQAKEFDNKPAYGHIQEWLREQGSEGEQLADILDFPAAASRFVAKLGNGKEQPSAIPPQKPTGEEKQPSGNDQAGVGQPVTENVPQEPGDQKPSGEVQVDVSDTNVGETETPYEEFKAIIEDESIEATEEFKEVFLEELRNQGNSVSKTIKSLYEIYKIQKRGVKIEGREPLVNYIENNRKPTKSQTKPETKPTNEIQQPEQNAEPGQQNVQEAKKQKDKPQEGEKQKVAGKTAGKRVKQTKREEVLDRIPVTAKGLARRWLLSGGQIRTKQSAEEKARGVGIGKGAMEETGMAGIEMRNLVGIVNNESGLSIEQAAESIWDNLTEEQRNVVGSDSELRAAIIDVLLSEDRKDWLDIQDRETGKSDEDIQAEQNEWMYNQLTPEERAEFDEREQQEQYFATLEKEADLLAKLYDEYINSNEYQDYIDQITDGQSTESKENASDNPSARLDGGKGRKGKDSGKRGIQENEGAVPGEQDQRKPSEAGNIADNSQNQNGNGNDIGAGTQPEAGGTKGTGSDVASNPVKKEPTKKPVSAKELNQSVEGKKESAKPAVANVAEESKPVAENLQDVGEKIGGAKKDIFQTLEKVTEDDIANKPLSKSFPRPDFQKLVADGIMSADNAIVTSFLYDEIPVKPRKGYKLKAWVVQVQSAIDTMKHLIENKGLNMAELIKKQDKYSSLARIFTTYYDVMKALNFPESGLNLGNYTIVKSMGNVGGIYSIKQGKSYLPEQYKTVEEAAKALKELLTNNKKTTKPIKFNVYSDSSNKKYFIGKKGAKSVVKLMENFESASEAFKFRKENQEQLEEMWNALKIEVKERREANRQRIGTDWRKGRNIEAKEFQETFGFRGVEFGNWVNLQERQSHVNDAYDALMDLSALLNIPPKTLALSGELGFAFGARGSGKNMAHYEPDKVVINLTKTRGAGSLAHEWWHAIDNYFSRKGGHKYGFLTDNPAQRRDPRTGKPNDLIREEMITAFKNVMQAIRKSNIGKRSAKLDQAKSKPYWSTPVELSARSFENFVIEKLGETNQSNDYLANFKEIGEWLASSGFEMDNYVYPLKEESPAINEAFQQFFDTIKSDELGVLYEQNTEYRKHVDISYGGLKEQQDAIEKTISEVQKTKIENPQDYSVRETTETVQQGDSDRGRPTIPEIVSKIQSRTVIEEFQETGGVDLSGRVVKNPQDVAELFEIHRSPYIEKGHVILLDNEGKILHNISVTLGLPAATTMPLVKQIVESAKKHNATGYYLIHNHPSGNHLPSSQDINMTAYYTEKINELAPSLMAKGHVVIDHDKFSFISPFGKSREYDYKTPKKKLFNERVSVREHAEKGNEADFMAKVADELLNQQGQDLAVIWLSANLNITGYDILPSDTEIDGLKTWIKAGQKDLPIGSSYIIAHNNVFKGPMPVMPKGILDIINIKSNQGNYFTEEKVDYSNLNVKTLFEENREKYKDKQKVFKEKINAQLRELEKEIESKYGIDLDISYKYDHLTVSRIEVKKDKRNQGIGSKAMKELIDFADANNLNMALTPTSDFGGSVSRLKEFYKSFGFIPNKGKNRNWQTTESFIRKFETDNNPEAPRLSIQPPTGPNPTKKSTEIAKKAADFTKNWNNVPDIVTLNTAQEAFELYPELAVNYTLEDLNQVPAIFLKDPATGKPQAVLIASHSYLNNNKGVEKAILHEVIGHYGIREFLKQQAKGDQNKYIQEFNKLMEQVFEAKKDDRHLEDIAKQYFNKPAKELTKQQQLIVADEYLAHLAQDGVQDNWIDKAVSKLRQVLRSLGIKLGLSDAEIRNLIGNSMRIVRGPQGRPVLREGIDTTNLPRELIIGQSGAANLDQSQEATYRLDNLAVAREMEEAGKKPREIKISTGWEKGADGKWRYEIPDGKIKATERKYASLGDILDHPELYQAYPHLKNIDVSFDISPENPNTGMYRPFIDREAEGLFDIQEEIDVQATDLENAKSILLHEVQHAIQHKEGFAVGGNPILLQSYDGEINDLGGYAVSELMDLDRATRSKIKDRWQEEGLPRTSKFGRHKVNTNDMGELITMVEQLEIIQEYSDNMIFSELYNQLLAKLGKKDLKNEAFEKYRRLAGEVEARNVEARMPYSEKDRRNTLLSATEDVAREDQIFLYKSSNESMSLSDQTQSPAFKAWFGDSKVVDENGEPLVVYHGTAKDVDITEFAKNHPSDGIYFTTDPGYAESYTKEFRAENKNPEFNEFDSTGSIYPVYLTIKNPLELDGNNESDVEDFQSKGFDTEFLSKDGYDGVILDYGNGEKEFMVFQPDQIKSATANQGTFDEKNPDIRFMKTGQPIISKEEQIQKANELYNELVKNGFSPTHPYTNEGSFGNSTYIYFNDQTGVERKFRISDHSVSNINRIFGEYHFFPETDIKNLVEIVKKDIAISKQKEDERNKKWQDREKKENDLNEFWETIKDQFIGLTFKKNDRTYQKLDQFAKEGRTNIYQKLIDPKKQAFSYEWTELASPNEVPNKKPSYDYIENLYLNNGSNQDALNPDNPDIRFLKVGTTEADFSAVNSRNYQTAKLSWFEEKVIERVQDRNIRSKKLIKSKTGGNVTDKADFYTIENLKSSKTLEKARVFEKDLWNPMIKTANEIANTSGLKSDDISNYLKYKHHGERKKYFIDEYKEQGKKIPKDDKWPTGMTDEEAEAGIKKFEKAVDEKLVEKLNQQVRDISRFTTMERHRSGMITDEVFNDLLTRYDNYVPLTDWKGMEETNDRVYTLLMSAKGRTSEAADPLPFLFTAAQEAIMRGENNRVRQSVLEFVKENVSPGDYFIRQAYYVNTGSQDELGNDIWIETMNKPSQEQIDNGEAMRSFNSQIHRHVQQQGEMETVLPVMVKGKKVFIEFKDKNIPMTIKNIDQDTVPGLFRPLRKYTRWLSSMYTQYSPEFGARNLIRDMGFGTYNILLEQGAGDAAKTIGKMPKSMATLTHFFGKNDYPKGKDGQMLKEFMEEGSMTGFTDLTTAAEVFAKAKKEIDKANNLNLWQIGGNAIVKPIQGLGHGIEVYNKTLENAMRFSYYKTLRESGISKQQAAAKSKDLTVNFNRKGKHSSLLGSIYIFFNASVQGTERLLRGFANPKTRKKAFGYAGSIMMAGMMQSLLFGLFDEEDEDGKTFYEKIPEYIRRNNIIIPNFFSEDKNDFIRVPLPYGLNVFHAMGESVGRVITGKGSASEETWGVLSSMTHAFVPFGGYDFNAKDQRPFQGVAQLITPSAFQPVTDLMINQNFAGRKIYRENFTPNQYKLPDSQMYFEGVNPYIKEATDFLNKISGGNEVIAGNIDINPEWIEYGMEQYLGGPVQFVKNASTTVTELLKGEDVLKEPYLRSVPFVRSFVTKTGTDYEARQNFYENRDTAVSSKQAWEQMIEAGMEQEAQRFYNQNQKLIQLAEEFKSFDKMVKKYNQTINELKKADADRYDDDIEKLYTEKTQIMREFNKRFGQEMHKGKPNPIKEILNIN